MTQNASDVEIANQGFAAFRQDLNDVLEDITTLHSGTAAPSTTYANQWWYETDTDKLYIRNEDNDAWIEILTLDQANDHLATLGATITLDGAGNASIDGTFDVNGNELILDADGDTSITADTDDVIDFKTAGTDAVRIDAGQRLLVGTTAAVYSPIQLHLGNTSSSQSGVQIQSSTTGLGYVLFGDGSDADAYRGQINYSHSADSMAFNTAGSERMRIDSSGNVGIGTSSPQDTLHVTGIVRTPGTYNNTTGFGSNVFVQSTGRLFRSTSSARYKNTIQDATHGLTELLTLRSVTYKGNGDGDTVFGGLIAEEVHDAGLTEFVQYNEEAQPDALAYGNMVSLCVKAIQEQQEIIKDLEARIAALEAE